MPGAVLTPKRSKPLPQRRYKASCQMATALRGAFISSHLPPTASVLPAATRQVCQHATLPSWQRRNEAQFPREVLGCWCCLGREDFGPEIMPCQVLLCKTQWLVSSVSHNSIPRADAHGHLDKRSSLFCFLLPQSSAQRGSRSEEGAHHPNLVQ